MKTNEKVLRTTISLLSSIWFIENLRDDTIIYSCTGELNENDIDVINLHFKIISIQRLEDNLLRLVLRNKWLVH